MPPAKKVAQKPTEKASEQSEGIIAKKPVKRTVKKTEESKVIEESATDTIAQIADKDIVIFMKTGHSYYGPNLEFTKDAPFQRMSPAEATRLLDSYPSKFTIATKKQIEQFYSLG